MSWRFLVIVSLLSLLLASCAGLLHSYRYTITVPRDVNATDTTYLVYIDQNFGQADLLLIEDALDQWNYVFNGYAHFQIATTHFDMQPDLLRLVLQQNAFLILKIDSHNHMLGPHQQHTDAFVNYLGGHLVYIVRDRFDNDQMLSFTLHELGHALGARHAEGGLMAPYASPDDWRCVDLQTVKQVAQFNGWDWHHLNYCLKDQQRQ